MWPDQILYENVLLLLSDGASYMIKAASALRTLYSRMLHVTCVAHGLNRVCECVREHYTEIDSLVAYVKSIFARANDRRREFQVAYPKLPFPPDLIITRWCTWIQAAMYYHDNFNEIEYCICALEPEDAQSIGNTIIALSSPAIKLQIAALTANYRVLVDGIT